MRLNTGWKAELLDPVADALDTAHICNIFKYTALQILWILIYSVPCCVRRAFLRSLACVFITQKQDHFTSLLQRRAVRHTLPYSAVGRNTNCTQLTVSPLLSQFPSVQENSLKYKNKCPSPARPYVLAMVLPSRYMR